MKIGFKKVLSSLKTIVLNLDKNISVRHEAKFIYQKIHTLEFSFIIALYRLQY